MVPLSPTVVAAFCALALTVLVQAAALLIWGSSLTQRVKSLELRTRGLEDLNTSVALVKQTTDQIAAQLNQLTGSWLFREPPPYTPNMNPGPRG